MTAWVDAAGDVFAAADAAAEKEGIQRLKAENAVVGDACELVAELSEQGDISESDCNALAGELSDVLARYTKTDLKDEFSEYFTETIGDGEQFDAIVENRLEEIKIIHSTDAKQATVWRWHFSDGVMLETETSKDGGRKHHNWQALKKDYFDSLLALSKGEKIADPDTELRDPEAWQTWIDELIIQYGETVEHVGPRTEAVRLLRDFIERNAAYTELQDVRQRQGIWTPEATTDDEMAADGGVSELRVPAEAIKRICDQAGVTTRALQIELQARGHTLPDVAGVSDASYHNGVRVPYWVLSGSLADPKEIIEDADSPAEQVEKEQQEREEQQRDDLGAVDESGTDDDTEATDQPPVLDDDDEDDDYEPGEFDAIGIDDEDEDDGPDGGDENE
jgi:hypothetical protein